MQSVLGQLETQLVFPLDLERPTSRAELLARRTVQIFATAGAPETTACCCIFARFAVNCMAKMASTATRIASVASGF
jgi:hypothetical protein